MNIALVVIVVTGVGVTAAVVVGSLVWAAKQDDDEGRAMQKRLGIRHRTRLGR
jgi:hypothetical protein